MHWQVLCDFDGTVSREDVVDTLFAEFALPGWQDIEQEWQSGLIGSRECMARQVSLLRVAPIELEAFLFDVDLDPGFKAFAAHCQRRNVPLAIVSDGLDLVIEFLFAREGIDGVPIIANRLGHLGQGHYGLSFPHAFEGCRAVMGTCKCHVATRAGKSGVRTLLIGDGRSDFCLAEAADFTFAKDGLLRHVEAKALPHQSFTDFTHAIRLLDQLTGFADPLPRYNAPDGQAKALVNG